MRILRCLIALSCSLCVGFQAEAATIVFDFDSADPLVQGQNIPFDQTSGGVKATFTSPLDMALYPFSVQTFSSAGIPVLLPFSGLFLQDNDISPSYLDIQFTASLSSISMDFATNETDNPQGGGRNLLLTAYLGSTQIRSASAAGNPGVSQAHQQGVLSLPAGAPFDRVRIEAESLPVTFLLDNIMVETAGVIDPPPIDPGATVPEPGSFGLIAVSLPLLLGSYLGVRMRSRPKTRS